MGRWFHTGVCSVGNMYRGRVPPCRSSAGVGHCSPHPTRSLSWAFWAPHSTDYSLADVEPVSFYKTPRDFMVIQVFFKYSAEFTDVVKHMSLSLYHIYGTHMNVHLCTRALWFLDIILIYYMFISNKITKNTCSEFFKKLYTGRLRYFPPIQIVTSTRV